MIKPASDPVYPWVGTIFGTMILGIWYWCTDQSIVQKTLSAKDLENARKGSFFCAALKILPVFVLVLPGLIAKALYPTVVTGDNAYPTLVLRLLPKGLVGLMVAALLAALMSAMSSVLNSCSTLITMDIFRKTHPECERKAPGLRGARRDWRDCHHQHPLGAADQVPEQRNLPVSAKRAGVYRSAHYGDVSGGRSLEARHRHGRRSPRWSPGDCWARAGSCSM